MRRLALLAIVLLVAPSLAFAHVTVRPRESKAGAEERYTVRWTVRNDGRISEVLLDRRESNEGPLARCMRSQMAVWRYPRYEGELQHVEQSFLVTAR